jgi:cytochrome oxidase Cu insertion factor (SCO1/SenC/PrrC family)
MKIKSNKKIILYWILIISFMALIGVSIIIRDSNNGFGTVTFGSIHPFNLVNQMGEKTTKDDFSGMVWILNVIALDCKENSSCEDVKSMTMSINKQLENNTDIKLVSVIIDKENILGDEFIEFGKELNADLNSWCLLNGRGEELDKMKSKLSGNLSTAIAIDQNGVFRGMYNITKLSEVKKMIKEAKKLI